MKMSIKYKINHPVSAEQFIHCLNASTLGQRRPVDDLECMQGMVENSNLMVTAWEGERLVGIARSMTDFHYACYLSDIAVDKAYQRKGIGKKLQQITQSKLGVKCKLILIAAPDANSYYQHLDYSNNPRCWVLDAGQKPSKLGKVD